MEDIHENYPKYENMQEAQEDIYNYLPNLVEQHDISTCNELGLFEIIENNSIIVEELPSLEDSVLETLIRSTTTKDDESIFIEYNEALTKSQTDKYDMYQKLLKLTENETFAADNINQPDVIELINKLRKDYSKKLFRCSCCKEVQSIDVAFIYVGKDKKEKKKICRECAVKNNITRKNPSTLKNQLFDCKEEEQNRKYYFKCKRCKAHRAMNQFKVELTKKKFHITQCKFCSNLKFLYDGVTKNNGKINVVHRRQK